MKIYFISMGAGLLVGVVYSLLGVRSPAPPLVALLGLAGILIGEQLIPVAKRLTDRTELGHSIRDDCAPQLLETQPDRKENDA